MIRSVTLTVAAFNFCLRYNTFYFYGKPFVMDPHKKRKCITLEEKIKIIRAIEGGQTQSKVRRIFNLSKSTVNTIWKTKESNILAFEKYSSETKKLRKVTREDVDQALLKWFTLQRNMNVPLTGAILQAKAEEFAKLFDNGDFSCSVGWIERFKKRHDITFGKNCGEASSVSSSVVSQWIEEVWLEKKTSYADDDIFNADETGIFYRMAPDKTLKFKGEKCVGGKQSKERLSVLLCANMTGTEKRKLLVIGKSKNPRCFKNVKQLPVRYVANKKAWMTSAIFVEELRIWDKELSRKKRKILLIIDNCTAHPSVENLNFIELLFLPPNTSSKIQPMDQGIIRSLKSHYRKDFIRQYILALDNNEKFAVSVLDAVRMLNKSWQCVTKATIKNCFRHAGLSSEEYDDEENMPLSEWLKMCNIEQLNSNTDIDSYVSVDDDVITSEMPSDSDIVSEVSMVISENNESDDSEGDEKNEEPIPKTSDALNAIKILTRFFEFHSVNSETIQKPIIDMEDAIYKISFSERKQQKITDYFSSTKL